MRTTRSFGLRWIPVLMGLVALLTAACAESDRTPIGDDSSSGATVVTNDPPDPPDEDEARASTDRDLYTAFELGFATFENLGDVPLFLPGCAPFEFERSLNGKWMPAGPPFVCVWEGIAVVVDPNGSDGISFNAPDGSGLYRLRYDYAAGCELDLPLSEADCEDERTIYSNTFEVERELCDPGEFGCQFVPGAPNFLCADGVNIGGPSDECTVDPATSICGYEFLSCP